MKFKRVRSLLLAIALACSMVVTPAFPANASPEEEKQANLENQKAAVEGEVNDLQTQLNTLMIKMNELEGQLIVKGQELVQAQQDLAVAEEKKQQQYEDMKLRIKYMYEEGDSTALERVITSGSMAEALKQGEYVEKVHTYDREKLQEYAQTVSEVEDLKVTLEEETVTLKNIEAEYQVQSSELSTTIESKRAEVENLDEMIQIAAQEAEAARIRAAEEAAAAARAAEAERARAAARAAQTPASQPTPTQTTPDTPAADHTDTNTTGEGENTTGEENQENTTDTPVVEDTTTTTPEPSYDVFTGNSIVDRAYGWVGNAEYVWGACSPGAFDCSGFVSYCLTGSYSRLGTTYTFLAWPKVSDPQPGDVCVNAGHCGIYIGGGQMIHAATEGVGVVVGPVQAGMIYVRY